MRHIKKEVEEAKSEIKTIKQEGFALEIIKDQRKQNKRLFIVCLCLIGALVILGTYTIYLLNDIAVVETITETEEYNQNVKDTGDINNSTLNNGGVVNGNN